MSREINRRDFGAVLLVVTIWGASFTIIKLGLHNFSPMLLGALRYIFAAIPAILFIRPPAAKPKYWITYGLTVGVGQFGCLFYAIHMGMPAGLASVVHQSQALFTLVFSTVLMKEHVSRSQVTGLGIAATGLFFIGDNTGIAAIPLGALLITLAGAAFWGLSNIVIRKASAAAAERGEQQLDMLGMVVWSSLIPPVPFVLFALFQDSPKTIYTAITTLSGVSLFAILYLAFGATLFGFGVWSKMLSKYSSGQIAPLSLLVPVTGLLTAGLVLHEQLSITQWAGCFFVICGLIVATFGLPQFLCVVQDEGA